MSSEMERLRNDLDRHEALLGDHLRRLVVVEDETERARTRLQRLEADRAAVRALVRTTQQLAEQTRALAAKVSAGVDQAEKIADAAAERAVEKAYGRRVENRWRLSIRLATALTALAGVGSFIAYLIIR